MDGKEIILKMERCIPGRNTVVGSQPRKPRVDEVEEEGEGFA